jgi:thiamine pyrophosphokinase
LAAPKSLLVLSGAGYRSDQTVEVVAAAKTATGQYVAIMDETDESTTDKEQDTSQPQCHKSVTSCDIMSSGSESLSLPPSLINMIGEIFQEQEVISC